MDAAPTTTTHSRRWLGPAALLLVAPYLFTLSFPLDFADDSLLIYWSCEPTPLGYVLQIAEECCDEFACKGPFRPTAWAYWIGTGTLFQDWALPHRLVRWLWGLASALLFLWWLSELGLPAWPALLTGIAAFWNPYRNEIWWGLGLSEAIAMPFALLALVAALRAPRSRWPGAWDLLGWLAALTAVACKNTFAVIVPVQLMLRLLTPADGSRRQLVRSLLLGSSLLFPIVHFVLYKLHPAPKVYSLAPFNAVLLLHWGKALLRAISLEYLGAGVLLLVIGVWRSGQLLAPLSPTGRGEQEATPHPPPTTRSGCCSRRRCCSCWAWASICPSAVSPGVTPSRPSGAWTLGSPCC